MIDALNRETREFSVSRNSIAICLVLLAAPAYAAGPTHRVAPPRDSVTLNPGDDIQAAVDTHDQDTVFHLTAGIYRIQSVVPRSGDAFIGWAWTTAEVWIAAHHDNLANRQREGDLDFSANGRVNSLAYDIWQHMPDGTAKMIKTITYTP